jgi:hypothetical protein
MQRASSSLITKKQKMLKKQTPSLKRKRLQWYGHVKRMQEERLPKLIIEWIPKERRIR